MAKAWETLPDGRLKLTVSPDGGGPASVYYGADKDEILDKLADSQANANGRFHELRTSMPNGNGSNPPSAIQPKNLTPGERMEMVAALTNPATAPEAIVKVVESKVGPLQNIQKDIVDRASCEAAGAFVMETPDWYPSEHNQVTLLNYVLTKQWDTTNIQSYRRAYADLTAAQLLQRAPAQAQNNDEPADGLQQRNAANPAPARPQRYSTGIRHSDVSGTQPTPSKRLKYSREQIENMSPAEYKRLMLTDAEFLRCSEFYFNPASRKRASATA